MSAVTTPSSSPDISPVNHTHDAGVQTITTENELPPLDEIRPSISEPKPNGTGTATAAPPATAETNNNSHEHAVNQLLDLITVDLKHVKKASEDLKEYGDRVSTQITDASTRLESLRNSVDSSRKSSPEDLIEGEVEDELRDLKKKVMKLKLQIPSKYKPHSASGSEANKNQRPYDSTHGRREITNKKLDKVPNLCKNEMFENSPEFKDFKALYDSLNTTQKICLLCFSVFPENEIIKKRFMFYWWIGEGFVRPARASGTTAEQSANNVFNELMEKGFIEPFSEKRSLEVDRCKMHPFVRAAVVTLADKAKMFEFDSKGKPIASFSFSLRACLIAGEKLENNQDIDKVHMLINVDENFLELENPEFLSLMKNINVLCLGRWQTSPKHHIEVEDTKFLESLKHMKYLKFLSLQGISRIMELPGCISNLTNLTILDLRACHNLEEIPDKIGSLKSLTHLDMSECYLLDNMPKELSSLSKLQVLKGFVVGDSKGKRSCTLEHLAKLPELKKLSIYTGRKNFPDEEELRGLHKFKELRKLTIAWGRGSQGKPDSIAKEKGARKSRAPEKAEQEISAKQEDTQNLATAEAADSSTNIENESNAKAVDPSATPSSTKPRNILPKFPTLRGDRDAVEYVPPELPTQLEKLDLQCFPKIYAPDWLKASKLSNVKKLYVRGGTLRDLGQIELEKFEWEVEILRLKFLNEIQMDWGELRELFPNLIYLEKVRCPKLTLFPCDHHGVWMAKTEKLK